MVVCALHSRGVTAAGSTIKLHHVIRIVCGGLSMTSRARDWLVRLPWAKVTLQSRDDGDAGRHLYGSLELLQDVLPPAAEGDTMPGF